MRVTLIEKLELTQNVGAAHVEGFAPFGERRFIVDRFLRDGEELAVQRVTELRDGQPVRYLQAVLRSPDTLPDFEPGKDAPPLESVGSGTLLERFYRVEDNKP